MKTATSSIYRDNNLGLQKSYFIHKPGDNPRDQVFRNGQWISIEEHNAELMRDRIVAKYPAPEKG